MLLPLELNAQLTEIKRCVKSWGRPSLKYSAPLIVDFERSVVNICLDVMARIPNIEVPFPVVFDIVCEWVRSEEAFGWELLKDKYQISKEVKNEV